MTVAKAKGDKAVADILFSRLVRARGRCERCGDSNFDALTTAHIVRRSWAATRTVLDNAWCLCWGCHRALEDDPAEFMDFVDATIGRGRYDELRAQARDGLPRTTAVFWRDERDRLALLCREAGIDTRRSAPGWHLTLMEAG